MSPRLLRPRAAAGNFATDADARAYIEAVRIADGSYMERDVQVAINDFIAGCKADGIWSSIKASCILMGARTLAGALTPLVGTGPTNVNNGFVSGDYNRETGLVGNGSSKHLDTNRALNADPQNNIHCCVLVHTTTTGANSYYLGANSSGSLGAVGLLLAGTAATGTHSIRGRSGGSRSVGSLLTGAFGFSRAASTGYSTINGGVTGTQTQSSSAPGSETIRIFATNEVGTIQQYSSARIQFYSIGESLDLSLLSARLVALRDAIGAAI